MFALTLILCSPWVISGSPYLGPKLKEPRLLGLSFLWLKELKGANCYKSHPTSLVYNLLLLYCLTRIGFMQYINSKFLSIACNRAYVWIKSQLCKINVCFLIAWNLGTEITQITERNWKWLKKIDKDIDIFWGIFFHLHWVYIIFLIFLGTIASSIFLSFSLSVSINLFYIMEQGWSTGTSFLYHTCSKLHIGTVSESKIQTFRIEYLIVFSFLKSLLLVQSTMAR